MPESKKNIIEKVRSALAQAEWPGKVHRFFSEKVTGPLGERMATWHVREKFVKLLPQDLARTFPRSFDPLSAAEWLSQAFQKQGAAFYGKLATVLLCTYFLADASAYLFGRLIPEPPAVRPFRTVGPVKRTRTVEDLNVILGRNLFNSQHLIPGEETIGGPGGTLAEDLGGAPVRSSLPFNLVGTLVLRDEIRSIATIEDKSANMVYPVRITDEIPSKARILKIEPRRVVFVNVSSGRREYIEMPQDTESNNPRITLGANTNSGPGIEKLSPTQYSIARTEVDKSLADLNNVLTQARCVPNFENGLPAGYKCFQIVPGSIYDKLGLQNNDVITSINGQSITDPAKAFEQLQGLREARHIDIAVKRGGRPFSFSYDIR